MKKKEYKKARDTGGKYHLLHPPRSIYSISRKS